MISADVMDLLAPLERFEEVRRRAVRLGGHLADLSYANPYSPVDDEVRNVLRDALAEERTLDLQYTPFGGHVLARRHVADALRSSTGLPFTFRDVTLTPGAMAALNLALRCVGGVGGEVVIPVPCWLDYPLYVRAIGLVPVLVPLCGPRFDLDVGAITDAVSSK